MIVAATISTADHGVLTASVTLNYGDSAQAFGGHALYVPRRVLQANYAGHFIWRVLEIAGVTLWSDLVGKTVRARCEHAKVHAIGHIVKDDWFDPSADFKQMEQTLG